MITPNSLNQFSITCLTAIGCLIASQVLAADTTVPPPAPIPFDQIGVVAQKQYNGDGLAVTPSANGAKLRCVFQRLEGEATSEGLWLHSTAAQSPDARFRVVARSVGRDKAMAQTLSATGTVEYSDHTARLVRPGLTEEYSVSMDGVRQDFVVSEQPSGSGPLRVELGVMGARAKESTRGAQLVLDAGGRILDYGRLKVTDASGKILKSSIEVTTAHQLVVVMQDAGASYPVRIDPTFSDGNWDNIINAGVPGMLGDGSGVRVMVTDGSGNFYLAGNIFATNIVKWDGSSWSAVGGGLYNSLTSVSSTVNTLAMSGTNLYAGGSFNRAGGVAATNLAVWNGSTWTAAGSTVVNAAGANSVSALLVSGTNLYIGGAFSQVGGVVATNIARWNGSAWAALGSGLSAPISWGSASTLAGSDTNLYAGGTFTVAGGVAATNIARWNGSSWSAVGSGLGVRGGNVSALVQAGTNLYAGGGFNQAGNVAATNIAVWNGSIWSTVGLGLTGAAGFSSSVSAIALVGTNLWVAGSFTSASGAAITNIAMWNGSTWSAEGSGIVNGPNALALFGTNIYVGGGFTFAGNVPASYVARLDGSAWSGLSPGMNSVVTTFAAAGTDLYVGGNFTSAGAIAANYVAKWDGSTWSALGSGLNGFVNAMVASGTNLYVGGNFTMAGSVLATNVAVWNGSSWSAVGSGLGFGLFPQVTMLASGGSGLYAVDLHYISVQSFPIFIQEPVYTLSSWNGGSWSPLISYTNDSIDALAASGANVFMGGSFTSAGSVTATNIARWNGSTWSALGNGVNSEVSSLLPSGTNLYAGGLFSKAGTVNASCIALWNGLAWSALGSGITNTVAGVQPFVYALALSGTNLFAGGVFNQAGGSSANNLAVWNGSTWSAIGSGVNGSYNSAAPVRALAVTGDDQLAVGGTFITAGTNVAPFISELTLPSAALPLAFVTNLTNQNILLGTNATFNIAVSGTPPFGYQWYSNGVPVSGATGSQLTINGTTALNTNAQYQIVVTNTTGSVTSSVAQMALYVAKITGITQTTNHIMTVYCAGLPNTATRMWGTTNLLTPLAQWSVFFTNYTTSTGGLWQVVDTSDTNFGAPNRFYKFTTP